MRDINRRGGLQKLASYMWENDKREQKRNTQKDVCETF